MFFEACDEGCSESPFFAPPGTYRTGGRYRYVTMLGSSARLAPFAPYGSVGHVRHYQRGACSAEIDDLTPLVDGLIDEIRDWILEDWHIYGVSVRSSSLRVVLGSPACDESWSFLAPDHDYVHVRIRLRVKPLSAGYWYHDIDAWWRFTAGPRTRLLYCNDQPQTDVTTRCIIDSDCWNEPYSDVYRDYCHEGWCRRQCGTFHGDCDSLPNTNDCGSSGDRQLFCNFYFAAPPCSSDIDCAAYPGAYCDWKNCRVPCGNDDDCEIDGPTGSQYLGSCNEVEVPYCALSPGCHTMQCDPDYDECATWIPGSVCTETDEGHVCQKQSFLDAVDYGIQNEFERHCKGDLSFCKAYYNGYKEQVREKTRDPYPILAEVINRMYDETWMEVELADDVPIPCAGSSQPVQYCLDVMQQVVDLESFEQTFDLRCGPTTGNCEVRPFYVYGVNLYPDAFEAILAQTSEAPEYTTLSRTKLCNPDWPSSGASWSEVEEGWWR